MPDKQSSSKPEKNPGNFKNDAQRAAEAGKKGGEQSHAKQPQGGQGGSHEQHVKAGQQSHKNK